MRIRTFIPCQQKYKLIQPCQKKKKVIFFNNTIPKYTPTEMVVYPKYPSTKDK